MTGARSLTAAEERSLVRRCRRLNPRNRALICAQLFLGFRISEILALTVGHVVQDGRIARRVTLPPRFLKGGYGGTRSVPVGPELVRALEHYLRRRGDLAQLERTAPLFLSREHGPNRTPKPLSRSGAEKMIKQILTAVSPGDRFGLSTHTLRKSWARRLYEESGHDLLCVKEGLGHSSVAITQRYLPVNRGQLDELILRGDWTRQSRRPPRPTAPPPMVAAA
jgi:integrase